MKESDKVSVVRDDAPFFSRSIWGWLWFITGLSLGAFVSLLRYSRFLDAFFVFLICFFYWVVIFLYTAWFDDRWGYEKV